MKILSIEPSIGEYWAVKCEGLDMSIQIRGKPQWNIGDDINPKYTKSKSGKSYVLVSGELTTPTTTAPKPPAPPYQKPAFQPKDELWTTLNCAYMIAEHLTLPSLQGKAVTPSDAQIKAFMALGREIYLNMAETKTLASVAKNG